MLPVETTPWRTYATVTVILEDVIRAPLMRAQIDELTVSVWGARNHRKWSGDLGERGMHVQIQSGRARVDLL